MIFFVFLNVQMRGREFETICMVKSVHLKTAITLYLTLYLQLYKWPGKICRKIPLFITINVQGGSII